MGGEWRRLPVAELIGEGRLVVGDGYRAKNEELGGSGLPFARAGNIVNGFMFGGADRFAAANLGRVGHKVSRVGDAVLTSKGTVGRVAFVSERTERFVYSPQLCFWRSLHPATIHPQFLYYWLSGYEFAVQVGGVADQTDMAAYVNLRDQRRMHITLPPLPEQRAIAHILGTLDDKIELNRRMCETLEAMARALFKSWFVDFDPVRARMEGRDTGLPREIAELFPDRLVESELGEIPEGWRVGTVGDVAEVVKGRSYSSAELVPSATALVTLKSFARGGGYRPDGLKAFSGTFKADQIIRPGDIVVACTDVTQAAEVIGRPALVRGAVGYRTLVASLDTLVVRPRRPGATRAFLYYLCGTDAFVAHTYAHTTGTTVLHLAKEAVPSFPAPLPPERLLHKFDAIASPTLSRILTLGDESDTLAALRDTLLPKLVSGEVRVGDAERFLAG